MIVALRYYVFYFTGFVSGIRLFNFIIPYDNIPPSRLAKYPIESSQNFLISDIIILLKFANNLSLGFFIKSASDLNHVKYFKDLSSITLRLTYYLGQTVNDF